jgi:murein DD-endopeptidase MepM/ murein hydrolase activator NlpD
MKKKRLIIILILASGIIIGGLSLIIKKNIIGCNGESAIISDSLMLKPDPPLLMFGIPVDSYYTETGTVKRNQILSQIVGLYNLPERSLSLLCTLPKAVFDMRKIKAGNNYMLFISRDTLNMLRYLVYEHSPVDYTIFDFSDSLKVYSWKKDIRQVEKRVQGKIESSLWNTITQQNISHMLALELSDIYAWTIDFFGLQPGDSFSVVYDELYVDDNIVGLGHIHAAYFRHNGNEYYAIPFVQDSIESYYDIDGNSLRRAFLKAPLHFRRIASKFSHSRFHPILKIYRPHHGVDYSAPVGTPVYSIGDGKVIEMAYKDQAGRMVKIRHNSIYTSAYLHLSSYAKGIRPGVIVRQGDVIGYVGSSGLSTGPHLDFRVYKNGSPINPLKIESPPVEPVRPEYRYAFDSVKACVLKKLAPPEENTVLKMIEPVF